MDKFSISRTPPASRSWRVRSITWSHRATVFSVGPSRKDSSPSYSSKLWRIKLLKSISLTQVPSRKPPALSVLYFWAQTEEQGIWTPRSCLYSPLCLDSLLRAPKLVNPALRKILSAFLLLLPQNSFSCALPRELPVYKRITKIEIRNEEFVKTTTKKIKR